MALKALKVKAEAAIYLLELLAEPEHEAKGERVNKIEVGQNAERDLPHLLQVPRIMRRIRHDRDHVASCGNNIGVGTRKRMQLKPAIIAPRPAIEADDKRPLGNELRKLDQIALAVGHGEIGHHLADGRNVLFGFGCRNALYELVVTGALIVFTAASVPARAEDLLTHLEPVGQHEPILTAVGNKRIIAFYVPNSGHCTVNAVVWENTDADADMPSSSVRVRMRLKPGQVVHIDSVRQGSLNLESLNLRCGDNAASLAVVDISELVASGRN